MASRTQIDQTYTPMDGIFQLMMDDEHPDITNSWPGDYGPPTLDNLKKAQRAKHEHYLKMLGGNNSTNSCPWENGLK